MSALTGNYAEFGNNVNENLATVYGNVGVSANGTFKLSAPSSVHGDVYLGTGVNTTGDVGTVTGTTYTNQNLASLQSLVGSASTTYAGLSPDQTFTTLNSAEGFSAAAGNVTVVDITNVSLNNANISFTGAGYLVLNISGNFSLVGSAQITDLDPTHVIVNYTGTGTMTTNIGDSIDGYIFDPNGSATFDGTFDGGLYGGSGQLELLSGAKLTGDAPAKTPDTGSSALLLALAVGGLVAGRLRDRRVGCR